MTLFLYIQIIIVKIYVGQYLYHFNFKIWPTKVLYCSDFLLVSENGIIPVTKDWLVKGSMPISEYKNRSLRGAAITYLSPFIEIIQQQYEVESYHNNQTQQQQN